MNELTFINHLLKIYTNKNTSIFKKAGVLAFKNLVGRIGIIYDDYDYKEDLKDLLKKDSLDKIFINAPRRITIMMDDKIYFHNIMNQSDYTPESYLSCDNIIDKTSSYFVKKSNSTGGKGVNIYNYDDLLKVDITNCVIQKNISNPDLYENKRYKIRQLVLLYEKNVYLYKNSFFTVCSIKYDKLASKDILRDIHVINQKEDTIFELSDKIYNFDIIYKNIILAIKDFKKYYQKEINNINGNIYGVLGFDFIVDDKKNVQIIEINHRSNYGHPNNVSLDCDIGFFRDIIILLANNRKSVNLQLI